MAYHNFDDVFEVAQFLSGIGLEATPLAGNPDTYHCLLTLGSATLSTTYPSRPGQQGMPTVANVVLGLASDASAIVVRSRDDFLDGCGFQRPSEAIRAYESCQTSLRWLTEDFGLDRSDLTQLSETLGGALTEVRQAEAAIRSEREAEHARTHPEAPEGFVTLDDLEDDLDLGDWGDRCPDYTDDYKDECFRSVAEDMEDISFHDLLAWLPGHTEWFEVAADEGTLEGCGGDVYKMIQAAQYECYEHDLYAHEADICKYAVLEGLKDKGVYALSDDLSEQLLGISFSAAERFSEDLTEALGMISDAMDAPIYEALGCNEEILEGGTLAEKYAAIKASGFGFPNPCAMSVDAVRTVNKVGYARAFRSFWQDFMPDGPQDAPSLPDAAIGQSGRGGSAKFTASAIMDARAASKALAQDADGSYEHENRGTAQR